MQLPLRVLVAPSGFKESLGAEEVADCIQNGILRAMGDTSVKVRKVPLHDGGEGFCRALVAAHNGTLRQVEVMGPVKQSVQSCYGLIGPNHKTAVLDMASAAGLSLVPTHSRDPTKTTTYGVGQLIAAALDDGCTKIIIGCGDSGTSDGGAGMLQALGARFLNVHGEPLPVAEGGGSLVGLTKICFEGLHPKLRNNGQGGSIQIEAVCNIQNILCGERGVARVYGPQKGATAEQVEILSAAMDNLATAANAHTEIDLQSEPGAGASGGLGAGLLLLNASLRARADAIDEYFQLHDVFNTPWDIVFTAEGSLDYQSAKGKMTVEVARRARQHGCSHVIALAGTIGDGAESVYGEGIAAFTSILDGPLSLKAAIEQTPHLLTNAAERTMRLLQVGLSLHQGSAARRQFSAPILMQNSLPSASLAPMPAVTSG